MVSMAARPEGAMARAPCSGTDGFSPCLQTGTATTWSFDRTLAHALSPEARSYRPLEAVAMGISFRPCRKKA